MSDEKVGGLFVGSILLLGVVGVAAFLGRAYEKFGADVRAADAQERIATVLERIDLDRANERSFDAAKAEADRLLDEAACGNEPRLPPPSPAFLLRARRLQLPTLGGVAADSACADAHACDGDQ